jgi:hypothetical protein
MRLRLRLIAVRLRLDRESEQADAAWSAMIAALERAERERRLEAAALALDRLA